MDKTNSFDETFDEIVVATNAPRLVVLYKCGEDGSDRFEWGIVGNIPVLTLIGAITRIQGELPLLEPSDQRHNCPHSALVIAWGSMANTANTTSHKGQNTSQVHWFIHPDIPLDPLMGMLETVKDALISSRVAQRVAAEHRLLGPDGSPMRG